jgi:hypothetical protein
MAPFHVWLEVLSYVKALFEATMLGKDVREQIRQHRNEPATIAEARRLSLDSTYSDEEVEAILERLKACQELFVKEGNGAARKRCMCNVFKHAIDGNGGKLPRVDDWQNIHRQLNCPRS